MKTLSQLAILSLVILTWADMATARERYCYRPYDPADHYPLCMRDVFSVVDGDKAIVIGGAGEKTVWSGRYGSTQEVLEGAGVFSLEQKHPRYWVGTLTQSIEGIGARAHPKVVEQDGKLYIWGGRFRSSSSNGRAGAWSQSSTYRVDGAVLDLNTLDVTPIGLGGTPPDLPIVKSSSSGRGRSRSTNTWKTYHMNVTEAGMEVCWGLDLNRSCSTYSFADESWTRSNQIAN